MAWTLEEKQQWYDKYGYWPDESGASPSENTPAHTDYRTTPREKWEDVTQSVPKPDFPLEIPREAQTFHPFDVQGYGQNQEDKKRAFFAMAEADQLADIQKEYDLTSRVANMGRAFNVSTSAGGQVATSGSTADPAKGIGKREANARFTSNLLKAISNAPGRKLSGAEITDFLDSQNAGPEQIKIMKSMSDWVELGDIKTLFRIDPETGKLGYLNRYPYQITPEIRAAGWKDDLKGLKFQRDLSKDEAAQKKEDRLIEIQEMITGLLPSPDASNPPEEGKINWIPQNEEQYQKLKQQWGIKLPEAEALLRTQLGLKGDGGKEAYAYTNEEGKTVTLMLNPREFATKVKQKKYKGLKPYDIHGKETIAAQNDMISNLAAAEGQRVSNTELGEEKVTPLTLLQFQQLAVSTWAKSGRPIGDSKRFNEQSAAAFMGEQKKQEQYNTDLSILMGQISTFTDWDDFANKSKGMDNEAVIKVATEVERRNKNLWDYTGPRIVFDRQGKKLPVSTWPDLLKARQAGYDHDKYNDAEDRPVHKVSDRYWISTPPAGPIAVVNVQVTDDNQTGLQLIRVWTPQGEMDHINNTRNDISQSVSDFEEFTQRITMIIEELKEGQRGTDLQAIRDLEKLKDKTGVIRESDVRLIKESIGTYGDMFERFINKLLGGEDTYLTQNERDQVANAALTTLMVLQASMRANINKYKLEYENDTTFTWVSKGRDIIDFHSVLNKTQYDKYMERKKKEEYWDFQPSFSPPTVNPAGEITTSPYSILLPDG